MLHFCLLPQLMASSELPELVRERFPPEPRTSELWEGKQHKAFDNHYFFWAMLCGENNKAYVKTDVYVPSTLVCRISMRSHCVTCVQKKWISGGSTAHNFVELRSEESSRE
jgi:hypothetical protein